MENSKRPSWDEYFIEICKAVNKRATCDRGRNGVVIVKDKRILSTGYVGSPPGLPHCDEAGHLIKEIKHEDGKISKHCLRTTHAELNAITFAAKEGISLNGATIYTLLGPCVACAKAILNCGIKRVVCAKKYHQGEEAHDIFLKAGIQVEFLSQEIEKYDQM